MHDVWVVSFGKSYFLNILFFEQFLWWRWARFDSVFFPTNKNDCYILKLYESWHHPQWEVRVTLFSLLLLFRRFYLYSYSLHWLKLIAVVLFYSDQSLVAMALPKFLFRTTHIHKFTPLFTLIQPPAADSLKS